MVREVEADGRLIRYNIVRKKVKNINLRVKPDKSITVSANNRISIKYIDDFVLRKSDFIFSALDKFSKKEKEVQLPNFSNEEFIDYVNESFEKTYILFSQIIKKKPILKIKKYKSRWGFCNFEKYIISINSNMIYCDKRHIDYVMIHEFAHFIVHNHSKDFYKLVEKYCTDYKIIDKELNKIHINRG